MEILCLESVNSTNSWVAENESGLPSSILVRAVRQTSGRGQRRNSWESAPGLNFTGSLLYHPKGIEASRQFLLSECVALAVVDTLSDYDINTKVKWPNDIYAGNKKICGILTEHVILGRKISRTIAGIGVNVNQESFLSDAPNPISMKNLTGRDYDLEDFTLRLAEKLEINLGRMVAGEALHQRFLEKLWRFDNKFHPFIDHKLKQRIDGRIHNVGYEGILHIETSEGQRREYAFKEIEFLI